MMIWGKKIISNDKSVFHEQGYKELFLTHNKRVYFNCLHVYYLSPPLLYLMVACVFS